MPRVTITISKTGRVTREASGFKGESCLTKTEFLDRIFGVPEEETLKDSYYEDDTLSDGLPSGYCG